MSPPRVVLVLFALVCLAVRLTADAEPTSGRVVRITIAGEDDDFDAAFDALREPLESLHVVARTVRGDADPKRPEGGVDASVFIDLRSQDRTVIHVWPRIEALPPVERVLPHASTRAVSAEDVAYTVRAVLESVLVDEAARAVSSAPPAPPAVALLPPPPPLPAPPPRDPRRFGVDVALLGNVRGIDSSTTVYGLDAAVDVSFWGRDRFRPSLWLLGGCDGPFEAPNQLVVLTVTACSLRAAADVELVRVGPLRWAAGLGYGADLLHVSTSPSDVSSVELAPAATYVDPIASAQIVARARLFDRVGLLLAVTIDYDMAPHHFLSALGTLTEPVVTPWSVRPGVFLGFCAHLTGPSGCAGAP